MGEGEELWMTPKFLAWIVEYKVGTFIERGTKRLGSKSIERREEANQFSSEHAEQMKWE